MRRIRPGSRPRLDHGGPGSDHHPGYRKHRADDRHHIDTDPVERSDGVAPATAIRLQPDGPFRAASPHRRTPPPMPTKPPRPARRRARPRTRGARPSPSRPPWPSAGVGRDAERDIRADRRRNGRRVVHKRVHRYDGDCRCHVGDRQRRRPAILPATGDEGDRRLCDGRPGGHRGCTQQQHPGLTRPGSPGVWSVRRPLA